MDGRTGMRHGRVHRCAMRVEQCLPAGITLCMCRPINMTGAGFRHELLWHERRQCARIAIIAASLWHHEQGRDARRPSVAAHTRMAISRGTCPPVAHVERAKSWHCWPVAHACARGHQRGRCCWSVDARPQGELARRFRPGGASFRPAARTGVAFMGAWIRSGMHQPNQMVVVH